MSEQPILLWVFISKEKSSKLYKAEWLDTFFFFSLQGSKSELSQYSVEKIQTNGFRRNRILSEIEYFSRNLRKLSMTNFIIQWIYWTYIDANALGKDMNLSILPQAMGK